MLQLDSVCSGYQHYAYLTHDSKLGSYLGLLGEDHNYSNNDLYTTIGTGVLSRLKINNRPLHNKLSEFLKSNPNNLNIRDIRKKPIIVILYGAHITGILESLRYLEESFTVTELIIISNTYLAVVNTYTNNFSPVYQAFGIIVALRDNHVVCIKDKFLVDNNYMKKVQFERNIKVSGKGISLSFPVSINSFDKRKCISASFVNCIHRLDRLFILEMITRSGIPILCIHDCIIINSIHLPQVLLLAIKGIDNIYKNYTIINLIIGVRGSSPAFLQQQSKLLLIYRELNNRGLNLKCSSSSFSLNKGLKIREVLKLYNK